MIEITNVCKNYDTGNKALKNVNITIDDGEFVFIIGRSGAGKSTLLKMLLKEVEPSSGKIVVNDMNLGKMPRRYIPKYRRRLGVVFQDFRLLKDRNVYENVAFAQRVIGASPRKIKERVPSMLQWWDCLQNINFSTAVIWWRTAKSCDCKSISNAARCYAF